jgi:acylphosphatase
MNWGPPRALRIVVEGRVQGVGYREFVRRAALRVGVSGWVRNRSDGAVEAFASGPAAEINALLSEMRRGPRFAEVAGVRIETLGEADHGLAVGFVVRPTVEA